MKILLTSDTYLPSINGVVTSVNTLYKELKKRGNDVRILTLSPNGKEYVNGDIYYIKSFNVKLYPGVKGSFSFNSKCFKKLLLWSPEVVHSHTEFITMHYANKIGRLLKIPHVHTYHTMYEDYVEYICKKIRISKRTVGFLSKWAVRYVDRIIVPTKKVQNVLKSYGIKQPISIIPTGIDLKKFNIEFNEYEKELLKKKLGITKDEKVLLYLGRIGKEKNIEEIIKNFSMCTIGKKLIIVGDGPYINNLIKQVESFSLEDKVVFTGMVSPDEVVKFYKISHVFLTASITETQGLTYVEALASGVPIICRKDEANEDLIKDNFNGFKYYNKEGFKSALSEVLNNNDSFKENANKSVYNYSKNIYAEKVTAIYYSLTHYKDIYGFINNKKENLKNTCV
ncbi:glycosyltransferase [Clostridium rectalis]|uniref:glycosyltransferase n=1 Tax=Clostridium rectalis TaxID=2040295 RepID=UPI000F63698B|nr:glycosyltransferase [Clostridium rectalis]